MEVCLFLLFIMKTYEHENKKFIRNDSFHTHIHILNIVLCDYSSSGSLDTLLYNKENQISEEQMYRLISGKIKHKQHNITHTFIFYSSNIILSRLKTSQNTERSERFSRCTGIASGMYHLSKNNIVHRDLAARNILVNTRHTHTTPSLSLFKSFCEMCRIHFCC
jgi:serine/threonine protein kinase